MKALCHFSHCIHLFLGACLRDKDLRQRLGLGKVEKKFYRHILEDLPHYYNLIYWTISICQAYCKICFILSVGKVELWPLALEWWLIPYSCWEADPGYPRFWHHSLCHKSDFIGCGSTSLPLLKNEEQFTMERRENSQGALVRRNHPRSRKGST